MQTPKPPSIFSRLGGPTPQAPTGPSPSFSGAVMQGAHPSGSVLTPPRPDPQLSKGAMPAFLMNTAAPSWAGLSQADPMDVSGSPLHQDSDMEGVTLGPSSSGLAALPGSLPGAGQSSAWGPQPPAPPIQPLQLPVQVNGINFGLPIPAATAGTSQGLQSPVQSGSFWFGVPSGATSSGGQTVGVAQAAPAAQSPVQVGGFYFGVPSVAGVATDNSAPVRVPQTAPASPLAPPSPSTPAQGLWPQGFASFTPASAVQPGKQQPEQRSDSSSPPPVAPPLRGSGHRALLPSPQPLLISLGNSSLSNSCNIRGLALPPLILSPPLSLFEGSGRRDSPPSFHLLQCHLSLT